MNRPAQNMNNQDIAPWGWIMLAVLVVGIWFFFHTQIATAILWLRWVEAHLMVFDPDGQAALGRWLGKTTAKETTIGGIVQSGNVAGYSLRWFSLAFIAAIFAYLLMKSPGRVGRYGQKHTMRSLAELESDTWPGIKPVLDLDLVRVPLDHPVLGMRIAPLDYMKQFDLLLPRWTTHAALSEVQGDIRQLDDGKYVLVDKLRVVLRAQLGRKWESVADLLPYERALFAAFAAQINHDQKTCGLILDACSRAANEALNKGDPAILETKLVTDALDKHGNAEVIGKIIRQHGYVRTVLMHLLESARRNGVIASARFVWLKRANRLTWYCLADLGMLSSIETCGVRAHYLAERKAKVAMEKPLVETAVTGIVNELNRFLDPEDEEEDV